MVAGAVSGINRVAFPRCVHLFALPLLCTERAWSRLAPSRMCMGSVRRKLFTATFPSGADPVPQAQRVIAFSLHLGSESLKGEIVMIK